MRYQTLGLYDLKFKVSIAINHKFKTDSLETIRLAIEKAINDNANHTLVMGESTVELLEKKND